MGNRSRESGRKYISGGREWHTSLETYDIGNRSLGSKNDTGNTC